MTNWESQESSDTCSSCKREVFGQCDECFPLMRAMADASRGFDTTSWDTWNNERLLEAQNQMDQDDNYIEEVTNG